MDNLLSQKELKIIAKIYTIFLLGCLIFSIIKIPNFLAFIWDNFFFLLFDVIFTYAKWCIIYLIFKAIFIYILKPIISKIFGESSFLEGVINIFKKVAEVFLVIVMLIFSLALQGISIIIPLLVLYSLYRFFFG